MQTHEFTLPSGVRCKVREMTGHHQELLTKNIQKDVYYKDVDEALTDLIVELGSVTNVTKEVVHTMLGADRKCVLIQARQFSLDFPETFEFEMTFEHEDSDGKKTKIKKELEIDISEGFPVSSYPFADEVTEYSDIDAYRQRDVRLPKSEKDVVYNLYDGHADSILSSMKKRDKTINSAIKARNPRWKQKKEGKDEVLIQLDISRVGIKDLGVLRDSIKSNEGGIDSEMIVQHPKTEEEMIIDLILQPAFFFPSQES